MIPAWKRAFSTSPKPSRGAVNPIHLPVQGSVKLIAEINKVVHLTYTYLQNIHKDKFVFLSSTSLIGTGDI